MNSRTIAVLVPFLAACAGQPPQWTKEGATEEQLYADQKNCERAASAEVQKRLSKGAGTMGPALVGPPGGRRANTNATPFADQFGTQQAQEDEIVRACMKENGYTRVKG
jgi:hypothetical protein